MSRALRVVSPYRPFPPESDEHLSLGPFDWVAALRMLAASVERSNRCETFALTDAATPLPVLNFCYRTSESRLMLWILEVSLAYLESDDFNCNTVMASPDVLVYGDLRPFFAGDLTVLVRVGEKNFTARPILNGVQWWPVRAKAKLITFYRAALAIARELPEEFIRWGADTEPLRQLLEPVEPGRVERHGMSVSCLHSQAVMRSLTQSLMDKLDAGEPIDWPRCAVVDFKYLRKRHMAAFFDATLSAQVVV